VVRRSAALLAWLAALAAGVAYFLVVDDLPSVDGDAGLYLAGCAGAVAVALCALAPLAGREDPVALVFVGVGAALLATALAGQDVGAAANPVEAVFAASVGMLFAQAFGIPAAVVALPLLVGGIDAAAVLAAPDEGLGDFDVVDVLTFDLPVWGGGDSVTHLSFLDATFLGLYAAWALRFALRPRLTIPLMVVALAGAVAVAIAAGRPMPALAFLGLAFLLPNVGGLPKLLRTD
jgi:hypothetical protein